MKTVVTSLVMVMLYAAAVPALAKELVVYSARSEHLIKPLFDLYTEKTGIEIKYVTDKAAPLLARLKAEGANTPADLLITVDAGNLWHAAEEGVLAEIESETLTANVPAHLRDPGNRWFGLSKRARTIVYSSERVEPEDLTSYEDLADPRWKGRLCLRTSKKVYNQSLVAMMISRLGEARTEAIVKGWVANLATAPFSNDTKTMKAILAGKCDVAIVNTYYFGRLENQDPNLKLALFWANQQGSGVHVNVSGAGVTRHARSPEEALRFLEWLTSEEAQARFAGLNMEYPVNQQVRPVAQVLSWGEFSAEQSRIDQAGALQPAAVMLMDRAGYR